MPRRPRRHACLAVLATAAVIAPVSGVGPADAASSPSQVRRVVSGWLPYWRMSDAYKASTTHGQLIHAAMPFWYTATGTRTIDRNDGAGNRAIVSGLRRAGIKVVPTVTDGASVDTMARILSNTTRRRAHERRLVELVRNNHYQGINIDYESMAWHVKSRQQAHVLADGLAAFMHGLSRRMHRHGKVVSIAVIAKTSSTPTLAASVFNYGSIGRAVDRFEVMTYDYHWSGGSPGPVAPITWQRKVIAFTTHRVRSTKVELGLPSYGYDWGRRGQTATSVTYARAVSLARAHGRTIRWDDYEKSPYFTYRSHGVRHVVWFTNARAVHARLSLVSHYRLAGVAEWAFGYEDPRQWSVLRTYATG